MKKPDYEITDRQCPFLSQCALIHENRTKMPDLIARIEDDYCTKAAFRCARFQVCQTIGVNVVPPLLLPDQIDWARQIIEEYHCGITTDAPEIS
ncbi:MAG: hypothetical protein KAH06_03790 [Desulfobacterales bacterium]|nr:hypothetical protein [Desulfobacterales bacterium]